MKLLRSLLVTLLAALSAVTLNVVPAAHAAQNDPRPRLVAFLTGGVEVTNDGVPNQGDPDGSGIARLRLNPERGRVCIDASVRNVEPLTLAHIHQGAAGVNGPVVVDFTQFIKGTTVRGCAIADPALVQAILADPAGYYINLHNAEFRPGAVRGQLEPQGSLRSTFNLELTGAAELDPPGDPDGTGTARVIVRAIELEICLKARTSKVEPLTLAHIHQGVAGTNGPVVVDFTHLIDGTRVKQGCVTVDPNLLQAIRSNPANYYVNLHTADFPRGAVRGQLQ